MPLGSLIAENYNGLEQTARLDIYLIIRALPCCHAGQCRVFFHCLKIRSGK